MDFDDANGFQDIYLWDRSAPSNSSQFLRRISDGALGLQSRGMSEYAVISDDGSTIYFVGQAINLVPNANLLSVTAQSRIYKHSLAGSLTSLESLFPNGSLPVEAVFLCGTSWNGRFLLFHTTSRGFIPSDIRRSNPSGTNTIYLKDTITGQIQLVSINKFGNATNNYNAACAHTEYIFDGRPGRALSADARWAIFESDSSNLDDGDTTLGDSQIYLRDLSVNKTYLLTGSRMAVETFGIDRSFWDGCVLPSLASNATAATFWCKRYFESVLTFDTVVCNFSNVAVLSENISCVIASVNSSGLMSNTQRNLIERSPSLSSDGRYLTWASNPIDFSSDPLYRTPGGVIFQKDHVFHRDLVSRVSTWISRSRFPNAPNDGTEGRPAISADGRNIVYVGTTTTLIAAQNVSSQYQIYHYNISTSAVTRPVRPPCNLPTENECRKVTFQSFSDVLRAELSGYGEVVAFSLPGPPLSADVIEPPLAAQLPPARDNDYQFMYFNSIPDELLLIVRDDALSPAPLGYVLGSVVAVSDDARYIYIIPTTPVAARYASASCLGALFQYDSFTRTHRLISKDVGGSCAPLGAGSDVRASCTLYQAHSPMFNFCFLHRIRSQRQIYYFLDQPTVGLHGAYSGKPCVPKLEKGVHL